MKITVSAHQTGLFGQKRRIKDATNLATAATSLVETTCGPLPEVRITLTHERAMHRLATEADRSFAPEAGALARYRNARHTRRAARCAYGTTLLDPTGGIHVVVNVTKANTPREMAETLVHELVHAAQLNQPGARETHIRHLRHAYGVQRWSRREAADYDAVIDQREVEAHSLETLATRLT